MTIYRIGNTCNVFLPISISLQPCGLHPGLTRPVVKPAGQGGGGRGQGDVGEGVGGESGEYRVGGEGG